MAGYEPSRLSSAQRWFLGELLASQPDREIARAIVGVVTEVIRGRAAVDAPWGLRSGDRPPTPGANGRAGHARRRSARPALDVRPTDPIINFAERFGVLVEVRGRDVLMSLGRLKARVDASNERARNLMKQLLYDLDLAGYSVVDFRGRTQDRRQRN